MRDSGHVLCYLGLTSTWPWVHPRQQTEGTASAANDGDSGSCPGLKERTVALGIRRKEDLWRLAEASGGIIADAHFRAKLLLRYVAQLAGDGSSCCRTMATGPACPSLTCSPSWPTRPHAPRLLPKWGPCPRGGVARLSSELPSSLHYSSCLWCCTSCPGKTNHHGEAGKAAWRTPWRGLSLARGHSTHSTSSWGGRSELA